MGNSKIGIWGGPLSGKTTYLASLRIAALRKTEEDWTVEGDNQSKPGSSAFLSSQTNDLLDGRLPPPTGSEATYAIHISRTGGVFQRKRLGFTLLLHDRPGGDYAAIVNPSDPLWVELASCDGLVFLFDPDREEKFIMSRRQSPLFTSPLLSKSSPSASTNDVKRNYHYVQQVADLVAPICRAKGGKWFPKGRLPHYLAVCVTKFDQQTVFDRISEEKLVRPEIREDDKMPKAAEDPYVDRSDAKAAFEALADVLTINTIQRCFLPERVNYFVISATGFYSEPGGVVDRRDTSNVNELDNSIRSEVIPVNVFEPLIWLAGRN